MGEKPLFSIVMPVYGVEDYLEDSVDSVLRQTCDDFEVILVDDCSKDNCGKICDALSATNENVSVIHLKENGGLSNARNEGFKNVKGQYVLFMDSDDTVSPELLSTIKKSIVKNPAQVIVYGIHEEYFNEKNELSYTNDISYGEDCYFDNANDLRKTVINLEKKTLYGYAWNKVYSVPYLKNQGVIFENITLIEDITFNVKVFENLESLNILDSTPYNYKKRINGSLTNKFVADYYELHRKRVEIIYNQYKNWGLCDDSVKKILADIYARYIFSSLQRNCDKRAKMNHKDRKKWLSKLMEDDLWMSLSPYVTVNMGLQGILSGLLKSKMNTLCLMAGRFIYIVKVKLPIIFSKLR